MTLEDVTEMFDYLNENPTAAEILKAVYEVETKGAKRFKGVDVDEFEGDFQKLQQQWGQAAERPPADFTEHVQWATEQLMKMRPEETVN